MPQCQDHKLNDKMVALTCAREPLHWIKAFNVKLETSHKILNLNSGTPSDEPATPHKYSIAPIINLLLLSPSDYDENNLSKLYAVRLGPQ
jgi:hypothetical protein